MKKLLGLVFSILALVSSASADPRVIGQDYLALQSSSFNPTWAGQYLPANTAVGWLDWTFGTSLTPVQTVLTAATPKYARVHILNTTCVTNKNCGNYEIVYGFTTQSLDRAIRSHNPSLLSKFRARIALYKNLATGFPGTTFMVSPALEHQLSTEAWRILANETRSVWPGVQLVNSPYLGVVGERYLGAYLEKHGDKGIAGADIVSLDGINAGDIDMPKFLQATQGNTITFIWQGAYNCRTPQEFIDPRKRTACPYQATFEQLNHIYDPIVYTPYQGKECRSIGGFPSNEIWKPFSERYTGSTDKRQELPVYISKIYGSGIVNIRDRSGKIVGKVGHYGSYAGGGQRFYSGCCSGSGVSGYQFQKNAVANTGNKSLWLEKNGICKGPLNTAQRQGVFREAPRT